MDPILSSIGSLFATGPGVLAIIAASGLAVVFWRWPVALAALVFANLGVCTAIVYLHGAPGLLVSGQIFASALAAGMLGAVQVLRPPTLSLFQPGSWILRTFALTFIVGAWWFAAPDLTLPGFSLPETELLLWLGLCGLALVAQTNNPLFFGVGLLFWSIPIYAIALVLLPGSGLAALLGISELMVALTCSYLILAEPGIRETQARQGRAPAPAWPPAGQPVRLASNPLTQRIRPPAPPAPAMAAPAPATTPTTLVQPTAPGAAAALPRTPPPDEITPAQEQS